MNRQDQDSQRLLATVRHQWMDIGTCTQPADRPQAEAGVREALGAADHHPPAFMFIWVDSPMAGVLVSTYVGFALGEPLKNRMMLPLNAVLTSDVAAANSVRCDVDDSVWRLAREAVHRQVETELGSRGASWERWKHDMGNYAWDRVWQTVGDQVYGQAWEQQAGTSESLFEANLEPWADAMMDGQFSAGAMAQLDALGILGHVEPAPFGGLQRVARSCGWWWGFEAGAVLCERPTRFELAGEHVTIEFRDGWTVRT